MIGYSAWNSDELRLDAPDTARLDVKLDIQPIALDRIVAEADRRCRPSAPGSAPVTDALWQNVRTALASGLAADSADVEFFVERFDRQLTSDSFVVISEQRRRGPSRAPEAFRTVPIEQLDSDGFVVSGGDELVGPTGRLLLDPWFVDTHCLAAVAMATRAGHVGIRFTPNDNRRVPEIRGIIWLDSASLELRSIQFEYVQLRGPLNAGSHWGEQRFDRLADGRVIMAKWEIRSPIFQRLSRNAARIVAFHETGGEVLRANRGAASLYHGERAVIEGLVCDASVRVPGAQVALVGTHHLVQSDASGWYSLTDVAAGTYHLQARNGDRTLQPVKAYVSGGQRLRFDITSSCS
jgi:hypothetical protein